MTASRVLMPSFALDITSAMHTYLDLNGFVLGHRRCRSRGGRDK